MSTRRWIDERQSLFTRTNAAAGRLRQDMSATERRFWQLIRKIEHPGGRFRRQAAVGPYVLDFVHHGGKLAIELDGHFHDNPEAQAKDAERDAWLANEGFHVVRFRNEQIW
jgi:very-short-patch-repair endonuclease